MVMSWGMRWSLHLQAVILLLALHSSRAFLPGGGAVVTKAPAEAAATRRWDNTCPPLLTRGGTRTSRPKATSSAVTMTSSASDFEVGFSFSVAGLLFPYHLGVASALREEGLLVDGSPLAGASGGAIAAVLVGLDIPMETCISVTQSAFNACRAGGSARFRLGKLLRGQLEEILPEDAHERLNSWAGGVAIGVTTFSPLPKGQVIKKFTSREDVIKALLASCHIPLWVSPTPLVTFRGRPAMDGYFGNTESFGCPNTDASTTVCVSPFGASQVFGSTASVQESITRVGALVSRISRASQVGGYGDERFLKGEPSTVAEAALDGVDLKTGGVGAKAVACFGSPVISPEVQPLERRGQLYKLPDDPSIAADIVYTALELTDDTDFVRRLVEEGSSDARAWARARSME